MEAQAPSVRPSARCPAPGGLFPAALRVGNHALSLAADIPSLEACLALERAAGGRSWEGVHSPQAVPYCDFLMLRAPQGELAAVCRLMRLDGGNSIPNPLGTQRFQLSPLLTALRYSREGILEMGCPAFAPGLDAAAIAKAARLLWMGMTCYLERNGLGFVLGRDALAAPEAPAWLRLMDAHGLHPDLETEARAGYRAWEDVRGRAQAGGSGSRHRDEPLRLWPAGLQEALLRGCRLACEPVFDPASGSLEFVWVASRDMLSERGDWGAGG